MGRNGVWARLKLYIHPSIIIVDLVPVSEQKFIHGLQQCVFHAEHNMGIV